MMAEQSRRNVISLEIADKIPPLHERHAAKALNLLYDAVSSPDAKYNGLSENQIINAIKQLKPSLDEPRYGAQYTPVWNISSRKELKQIGLDVKEIEGLAFILPFGESSHKSNVTDQLIPEILFTLAILDYDEDEFRQLTSCLDRYPAVGVLLCEILTNSKLLEKAQQFLDRESTDQKREILLEYLKRKLANFTNLNIAHSLNHFAGFASLCGQYLATIVPKEIECIHVQEINDISTKVSESDITALATFISHSSVVKELDLRDCGLNSKSIASLQDGLKNSDVKIRSLDISSNWNIDKKGFRCLGNIVKKHEVEELKMCNCGLSLGKLKSFNDTSGNAKIRSLNISYNQDIGEKGFRCLGSIVKKHAVEELDMSKCGLSFGKLKSFNKTLGNAKICSLDISNNLDMGEKGFHSLGNIVKKHAVEELNMSMCGLSFGKLKSFDDASGNAKISSLDISGNKDMDEEGFRFLRNIVKKRAVEELSMGSCGLSFGKLKSFDDASGKAKIRSLNISDNEGIDGEGFRCLGNIVKKHAVEELNMSKCGLSFGKLKSFEDASGNAKIRSLNTRNNRAMDEEGFRCLGNIVKKHEVEELNMSECDLSFGKLESFDDASGNAKIRSLNISYNENIDEEGFSCLADIVENHAVEELNMYHCDLSFAKLMSFTSETTELGNEMNQKIKVLHISDDDLTVNTICFLTLDVTESMFVERLDGDWSEQDIRKLQDFIHAHHPGGLEVTLDAIPDMISRAKTRYRISKTVVVEEDSQLTEIPGLVKLSGNIFMYNKAPLSSGTQVYRAELRHASGKTKDVVVKLLPKDEKHKKEIDILLKLDDHLNIVKIIDSGDIPGLIPQLYVVMERCHQNLKQYVDDKKSQQLSVPFPKAKSFFKQMISAIVFIHRREIIHRDLKPSNILISADEESLKVADFGISRGIPEDHTQVTVTNSEAGTEGYKPPEAHQGTRIGYKADVFQMGINGYYIFTTGQHPFGQNGNIQAVNIMKNKAPNLCDMPEFPWQDARCRKQLTDLLLRMLAHYPAERPTAKQVSKDDFFKGEPKDPGTSTIVFNGPVNIHRDARFGSGHHNEACTVGTINSGFLTQESHDSSNYIGAKMEIKKGDEK